MYALFRIPAGCTHIQLYAHKDMHLHILLGAHASLGEIVQRLQFFIARSFLHAAIVNPVVHDAIHPCVSRHAQHNSQWQCAETTMFASMWAGSFI